MALSDIRQQWARPGGPWDVGPLGELSPPHVVDGPMRLTADEVSAAADTVATTLLDRGCVPGDVVAFHLPNCWQSIVLYHACWRAGAVALPLHHRLGTAGREELLARTSPRVTFVSTSLDPPPGSVVVDGPRDEFAAMLTSSVTATPAEAKPESVAVMLATSGSTGRPKLALHTHRGLHHKARAMVDAHGLRDTDVVLMPAPLAHISGLLNGILLPGQAGMTTVLMDRWDPAWALRIIEEERVSFMVGPPTFFVDLAASAEFDTSRVATMRLISCGGAAVTPDFVRRTTDRFDAIVKRTYGSTEAPTVTTSHAGDPPSRAADTDGRPVGAVQLRVLDPSSGAPLPAGQVGELRVRGPEVFEGYLDDATDQVFDDEGFFITGDLAFVDDEGWLTVTGRVGATIIRAGENVAPAAVEAACAVLPDVRNLAVVGYPDERLGERVALVVEADMPPPLHAVQEACRAAGLPPYAWPDRVVRVDHLPRLAAGKPDRAAVKDIVGASRN